MAEVTRFHRPRGYAGLASSSAQYEPLVARQTGLSRALGSSLWDTFPALPWLCDPQIANHFFDDFNRFSKVISTTGDGAWTLTAATSGTAVAGVLAGGVVTLDAGAATDGQGPQIQLNGTSFIPAAGKHLWFECQLHSTFITGDFFFGLAETDATIFASSDMTTSNHIGFSSFTGDGILLADANKATARVHTTAIKTLVASTYTRLGFYVNGVTDITFWADDAANATKYVTANIPIVALTPSFGVHATGTDRAVLNVDWVRVAQLR